MKKRRKVLAALISLLALAASIRIVYVSGFLTHKHSVRNTHVFTKKKDNTDKKKDDVEPSTSTTTPSTDKKDDVTTTTPSTTLKPVEKPADKPKEEEKPVEVKPTIEKPVETNTGDKIVGATDKGQVIVANDKGETTVVAPEKVGGEVKSDGSIQVKDKSGKLVKIPTTGVEAALVSIMLAGGSASTAGIASFLRSKRNK